MSSFLLNSVLYCLFNIIRLSGSKLNKWNIRFVFPVLWVYSYMIKRWIWTRNWLIPNFVFPGQAWTVAFVWRSWAILIVFLISIVSPCLDSQSAGISRAMDALERSEYFSGFSSGPSEPQHPLWMTVILSGMISVAVLSLIAILWLLYTHRFSLYTW